MGAVTLRLSRRAFLHLVGGTALLATACGGTAAVAEKAAEPKAAAGGHDNAETKRLWDSSGGDNLLKGRTFQALFQTLPDRPRAFTLKDTYLRCIDEGTPGGLHMAGSGALYEKAFDDLKGKITGIYTHEGCGAAKLYVESKNIKTDDPDSVADAEAKTLAEKLGVPYLGRIAAKDMSRPPQIHTARAIYYDGTGKFEPTNVPGIPQGFMISRKLISDPAYAKAEVEVAIGIAMGDHGFGSHFTGKSPLYLTLVGGLDRDSIPTKMMADEMLPIASKFHNVELQTMVVAQEAIASAPAVVKPADPSKDKADANHGGGDSHALGGALTPSFGPTLVIRDRIVNLADPGGRRYLRFTIAIEFASHEEAKAVAEDWTPLISYRAARDSYLPVTGGASKDPQKDFEIHMKRYVPAIEDAIGTVLSSKTYADLVSSEGKDAAKREIRDRVQSIVGDAEHVTNIYFTEFVVQ
ncbi:MAG: flagellar basal body-associated FliL family protein [Chloroflexota bacterium]|nr:MAG: flagellar basal body-associated FliL family protein [Chloroflexota bacterium]